MKLNGLVVLIKGAGEVASGVAHRLFQAHFRVCLTEISQPQAVSRGVTFSEAVYDNEKEIEGVTGVLVDSLSGIRKAWAGNRIPVIIDPEAKIRDALKPDVFVDAVMAKKNLGTKISDASLVIGLGPGFRAGRDVHVVVETNNTEQLGLVILDGEAEANTGIPIAVSGLTSERVIHADEGGFFRAVSKMGNTVGAGEIVGYVGEREIKAPLGGIVRALIRDGVPVEPGTKLLEIDPVAGEAVCYRIRARIRAIAGGVLEAIMRRFNA
ncbi:MAG: EF2563 family selenium-dependent molybdenum hydroxylase system protein [Dehalococcoidales bacterium]|nr:EF2563 family selenium-dependent molybdenum hydroxylase system protein [Dehalococcoidales bacterium]